MFAMQILVLLGLAAGQAPGQGTPRKLIASVEGKDLFVAYCASCHGMDATGNGPVAPALKGPIPDLTTLKQRWKGGFPVAELEKAILGEAESKLAHGSREMPVWGPVFRRIDNDRDLGLVRVRNLVDYLEKLQRK
jgi:mono/diheme cytochrome c family protein